MDKKNIIIFTAGVIAGSLATWKYVEDKYKKIADEEIADVKRVYSNKDEKTEDVNDAVEQSTKNKTDTKKENELKRNDEIIQRMNYSTFSDSKKDKKEVQEVDKPYIIAPEEFGECDYSTVSLTYYADGVLTYDEDDEIVVDIDDIVGDDAVNHFGEYEDDSVFIRNDRRKCDYEILYDQRNYHDIYPK